MNASAPFAAMRSRCPDPALRAAVRADPYWGGLWGNSSTATWLSRATAERMQAAGLGRMRASESRWTREEAMDRICAARGKQARLAALASVAMWRTVTVEQVASLVGQRRWAARTSTDRDLLWAAGLVHKGRPVSQMKWAALPMLLRPDPDGRFDRLSPGLTYEQWLGVCCGYPWSWGTQQDRHNVLATEIALRVAEWCDVGTVFGELLGKLALLAPTAGLPATSTRSADAVLVRRDGLKIAVEVTATITGDMKKKIGRWVQTLAADTTRSTAVLFLDTGHPDRSGDAAAQAIRRAVEAASRASMDAVLADVASRICVARWQDWFPAPGLVSRTFPWLPAQRPTGRSDDDSDQRWQPVNLLDPLDMHVGKDPSAGLASLRNSHLLYGVPHWLRDPAAAPDLSEFLMRQAGSTYRHPMPRTATRRTTANRRSTR